MCVPCQGLSYLCSKEVCIPSVETTRHMYVELNQTSLCSKFWGVLILESGLNLCFQRAADVVGYSQIPFWMSSMACCDSVSEEYPIPNEG